MCYERARKGRGIPELKIMDKLLRNFEIMPWKSFAFTM
jgi:hypothetical protein